METHATVTLQPMHLTRLEDMSGVIMRIWHSLFMYIACYSNRFTGKNTIPDTLIINSPHDYGRIYLPYNTDIINNDDTTMIGNKYDLIIVSILRLVDIGSINVSC